MQKRVGALFDQQLRVRECAGVCMCACVHVCEKSIIFRTRVSDDDVLKQVCVRHVCWSICPANLTRTRTIRSRAACRYSTRCKVQDHRLVATTNGVCGMGGGGGYRRFLVAGKSRSIFHTQKKKQLLTTTRTS